MEAELIKMVEGIVEEFPPTRRTLVARNVARLTKYMKETRLSIAKLDRRIRVQRDAPTTVLGLLRRRSRLVKRLFQTRTELRKLKLELLNGTTRD
jgi:hypothetical protein